MLLNQFVIAGLVLAIYVFQFVDARNKPTAVWLRSFCDENESCHRRRQPNVVMAGPAAGRVPAIHVLRRQKKNTWMAVTSTAMTMKKSLRLLFCYLIWPTGQPWNKPGHDGVGMADSYKLTADSSP